MEMDKIVADIADVAQELKCGPGRKQPAEVLDVAQRLQK